MLEVRLERRLSCIARAIADKGTAVINRLGSNKAEVIAMERFFNNSNVTIEDLLDQVVAPCYELEVEHVLVPQDTSQYNFDTFKDRFAKDDPHIGVLSNNTSLGLYAHAALAFDASNGLPIALSYLSIYNLAIERKDRHERAYKRQHIKEKHSYRWIAASDQTAQVLTKASMITMIADREADIYELLAHDYDARQRFIIRSCRNRLLSNDDLKLREQLQLQDWQGLQAIKFKTGHARANLAANVSIRFKELSIAQPQSRTKAAGKEDYPASQNLQIIEVKELDPAKDVEPIHWYLYTNHLVDTAEQAWQIVKWYTQRWWIEDFFRLTKSQGFEIEKSNFRSGLALKKLMHVVMGQAVKVLALRQGRTLEEQTAEQLFSPLQIEVLKLVFQKVEGKSKYERCPFKEKSIAWAAWIIGRLGGWKARQMDKRPPGVVSMIRGYRSFQDTLNGYLLFSQNLNKPSG